MPEGIVLYFLIVTVVIALIVLAFVFKKEIFERFQNCSHGLKEAFNNSELQYSELPLLSANGENNGEEDLKKDKCLNRHAEYPAVFETKVLDKDIFNKAQDFYKNLYESLEIEPKPSLL